MLLYPDHTFLEGEYEFPAKVLECTCTSDGSADTFQMYYPTGLEHLHVQCTTCGQSYCLFHTPCQIPAVPVET